MTKPRHIWSQEEKDALRRLWSPAISRNPKKLDWSAVQAIADKIGRPVMAVYYRARDMGLVGSVNGRAAAGAKALAAAKAMQGLKLTLGSDQARKATSGWADNQREPRQAACLHRPYLARLLEWNEERLKLARQAKGPWAEMEPADRAAEVAALRAAVQQVRSHLRPVEV